jgi:hypothetical protein
MRMRRKLGSRRKQKRRKEEPEPEKGSTTEADAKADAKTGVPVVDKTADDLADLLSRVSISGSRA